jgi:hypothetical protein
MADVQDLQSIHIKESIILIFFIMDDEKNNQHYSDDTSWSYIVCVCVLIHCRGVAYYVILPRQGVWWLAEAPIGLQGQSPIGGFRGYSPPPPHKRF